MMVDRWHGVAGDLTDQEWTRLEPLLPSMAPQRGILWRIDNGAKWDQIPDRYGPAKTCYDRFARWEQDGTWARIEHRLQADADAVGDLDWRGPGGPPPLGGPPP